ncbi:hypothetical protein L596_013744 [Steinernema carpocapsae]|uniref:Uncharacterized protein n=1 Tax=Steinernema carpocapsae TaxID=34508 RepID=A0A4U5P127_STECR|nr:hypothetical protein L596_013744 [Steinernema carpocapsae]
MLDVKWKKTAHEVKVVPEVNRKSKRITFNTNEGMMRVVISVVGNSQLQFSHFWFFVALILATRQLL